MVAPNHQSVQLSNPRLSGNRSCAVFSQALGKRHKKNVAAQIVLTPLFALAASGVFTSCDTCGLNHRASGSTATPKNVRQMTPLNANFWLEKSKPCVQPAPPSLCPVGRGWTPQKKQCQRLPHASNKLGLPLPLQQHKKVSESRPNFFVSKTKLSPTVSHPNLHAHPDTHTPTQPRIHTELTTRHPHRID